MNEAEEWSSYWTIRNESNYLAFCEICPTFETFDSAGHARSNGWGIYKGQQFCPEHNEEN